VTADLQARRALVERVQNSPSLRSSPRLQELFRYLTEAALRDPHATVAEAQIGVDVFGRTPDYDTSADTIVRVQVSQLRKKLEHYFLTEGREEPVLIDLPRGSYVPVFPVREPATLPTATSAAAETAVPAPGTSTPAARPRRLSTAALLPIAALAVAAFWFGLEGVRRRDGGAELKTPHRDHFWRQFHENHFPTQVVLSDAGVLLLAETQERGVSLSDYRKASYPNVITDQLPADEKTRTLLLRTASRGLTTAHDATVAHQLAALGARFGVLSSLVSAREFRMNLQTPENVILLGHTRVNPWVELFEPGLNFRYRFDDAKRAAAIVNTAPRDGEPEAYAVDWGRRGYCVIALRPKPGGAGNVLLIFGGELQSVEAGGHFLADEKALADLHARIGVGLRTPLPHFEVLLQTKLQGNATGDYEVVSVRGDPLRAP
jgi:hypothetical protein